MGTNRLEVNVPTLFLDHAALVGVLAGHCLCSGTVS